MREADIPLEHNTARGRNGMFDAVLLQVRTTFEEPEKLAILVYSRRQSDGQAPIYFELSTAEAFELAVALREISGAVLQDAIQRDRAKRSYDDAESSDNLPQLWGGDPE